MKMSLQRCENHEKCETHEKCENHERFQLISDKMSFIHSQFMYGFDHNKTKGFLRFCKMLNLKAYMTDVCFVVQPNLLETDLGNIRT